MAEAVLMGAHKYADLMALYAQDAAETVTPWRRWEIKYLDSAQWEHCATHPHWDARVEYRRRPQTSRERFEMWALGGSLSIERHSKGFTAAYASEVTHAAWFAWQEAERQAKENSDD
jgi:hypothetical protein